MFSQMLFGVCFRLQADDYVSVDSAVS